MAAKYHPLIRALHWGMALIILSLIAVGWYMAGIPTDAPDKYTLYPWHKSFGMLILFLAGIRLAVRLKTTAPTLPESIPGYVRRLARLAHVALYALMLSIPVTGYVMSMAGGFGVSFFGIPLPNLIGVDKPLGSLFHEIHGVLPYILLGIVALHALGAMKHRFFDKPENDVLKHML